MSIFFKTHRAEFRLVETVKPLKREQLHDLVTFERRKRSLRHEMFDNAIINDPCWHILEELYAAHLSGHLPRSKSICDDGSMAPTTVLRYLEHLEKFGLISRSEDPSDSRARLVQLTHDAIFWMEEYYSHLLEKSGDFMKRLTKSMGV